MKVEFWIVDLFGEYQKVTLSPGEKWEQLETSCDEGRIDSYLEYEYDVDLGGIVRRSGSYGYDCDGRFEHHYEEFCPLNKLCSRPAMIEWGHWENGMWHAPIYDTSKMLPMWEQVDESHRDYEAERAGY